MAWLNTDSHRKGDQTLGSSSGPKALRIIDSTSPMALPI